MEDKDPKDQIPADPGSQADEHKQQPSTQDGDPVPPGGGQTGGGPEDPPPDPPSGGG